MSAQEIIGIITGLLTIAGVVVAVTRHVTKMQFDLKLERMESAKAQAERAQLDMTATNKLLLEELAAARRTGAAASAKKGEVDEELASIMRLTQAGAGSVYLPLTAENSIKPTGLVFLSILPTTEATLKLRSKILPLQSLAGRALASNQPSVVGNAKSASEHFDKADELSGYQTQDTLTFPLRSDGRVVGVLQLLNKGGGQRFGDADIPTVGRLIERLAQKVDDFARLPGSLELLNVAQERAAEFATIMFCDLTASSRLFEELSVSSAVQHINEYFQRVCDSVFRHGGTIDKYSGDGALFRFNVPHRVDDHPMAGVRAALAAVDAFAELKRDWLTMGEALGPVHIRIGLAYGAVQQAQIGHPQYQYLTVFGTPVNTAVNLCDSAPRDRSVIVIDHDLYEKVGKATRTEALPASALGKASRYTSACYEVHALAR